MMGPVNLSIVGLSSGAGHALQIGWRILLIFVIAGVINIVVRRSITRITASMRARATDARADLIEGEVVGGDLLDGTERSDRYRRVEARARTVSSMLRSLSATVIFTFAVLLALGELKINLGPLIAGAGIAGIAVGFGAQSLVRDLLGGFFVLVEDQYGVGDIIDAGPAVGTVERITLRVTQLRDAAGTVWHIPNGTILRVGNKSQNWARAVIDVVVPHGTDVRQARKTLRSVADAMLADPEWGHGRRVARPDEQGVQALSGDGVTLRLVVDAEPTSHPAVERELRLRIKEAFDEAGIRLTSTVASTGPAVDPPRP